MKNRRTQALHLGMLALVAGLLLACSPSKAPDDPFLERGRSQQVSPEGVLYIIGGGKRPEYLLRSMLDELKPDASYGLFFPHASAEPDTAYHYFMQGVSHLTAMPIVKVGYPTLRTSLVDSVRQAAFIFLSGGDQNRFTELVHPAIQRAIREAYIAGAVVGGTSAGAALMSTVMITGDQRDWPLYESTYARLHHKNGIYAEGLGLIDSVVVDQHFVTRSRYNRIISALADTGYPYAIGVDEETALVVRPSGCSVVGNNQVVVMERPASFTENDSRIGARELITNIYLNGDTFQLKNHPL